jgi:c-di-GMP-binding flagellar brake protein YcgR
MTNYDLRLDDHFDILVGARNCISDLKAITQDGSLIFKHPSVRGEPIPIEDGATLTLSYFRDTAMLTFQTTVKRQFSQGGQAMIEMVIASPISKTHRRDFVRFHTSMPVSVKLMALPEETKGKTLRQIKIMMNDRQYKHRFMMASPVPATCLDIGGGGARISCEEPFGDSSLIECTFVLSNDVVVTVESKILSCSADPESKTLHQMRLKFVGLEDRIRQQIVRYVFEEQSKHQEDEDDIEALF